MKKLSKMERLARERIEMLFREADKRFEEDSRLSDRYVQIARRISMKYQVRLPSCMKRRVCKGCRRYLVPGRNVRVRLRGRKLVYRCMSCGGLMRFPYLREILDGSSRPKSHL